MKKRSSALSVTSIILAVVALLASIVGGLIAGTGGAIIVTVIAAIAALLAIISLKKGGKGTASIVVAVLAVIIAFAIAGVVNELLDKSHKKALEPEINAPLVAKYCEPNTFGFIGMFLSIPADAEELDKEAYPDVVTQFSEELKRMSEAINGTAPAATAAPAESTKADPAPDAQNTGAPATDDAANSDGAADPAGEAVSDDAAGT